MSIQFPPSPAAIVDCLLPWIERTRRDLPWRSRRDPYSVWISEIMLQQTQVATAIPYFERWMARFPDVQTLATASLDDVLKAWEGLGYYARARNLHRAAQEITARHNGQVPGQRKALLRLPGIGRSTAGAILSLAFGQQEPILDGNVRRVLCRLYDISQDPRASATEKTLWRLAEALVQAAPDSMAGDLNEGLMELGALICTPNSPDCRTCPLSNLCLAYRHGVVTERPAEVARRVVPHRDVTAGVIQNPEEEYLLIQRPPEGLLGGLWGFPGGQAESGEEMVACLQRAVREQVGLEIAVEAPLLRIKHTYTHFRITLHAFHCRLVAGEPRPLGCARVLWVGPADLASYPFPATDLKIVKALRNIPTNPG